MIIVIFLFALTIVFQQTVYSQRCGDDIGFSIINDDRVQMDSLQLTVTGFSYDGYSRTKESTSKAGLSLKNNMDSTKKTETLYVTGIEKMVEWKNDFFTIRTLCGIRLMNVVIKDNLSEKTMTLNIYNIPSDILIRTSDFIFKSGVYELNINRTLDMRIFKENKDGQYVVKQESFIKVEQ